MFGWFKSKTAFASFLKSDTEDTLHAIRKLPKNVQRKIAVEVLEEISRALAEIEAASSNAFERDRTMKDQIEGAKARRHLALMQGATNRSDPSWAAAALIESYLMANTRKWGKTTFDQISRPMFEWELTVLTHAEIANIVLDAEHS